MKEQRKAATDGGGSTIDDPMKEMRDRYERAVEAEQDQRRLAIEDLKFVTVPGHQWDEAQRNKRELAKRACYEFPILRSHWRQVVNDQKKSRPEIKVRAVKDATTKDAELRQGLIRNIESQSRADWAYDAAFELLTATGFGAWKVVTRYSEDDAWEQDLAIEPIIDPLMSVWLDPDGKKPDGSDAKFGFEETSLSREEFKRRYPKADPIDFESHGNRARYGSWCGEKDVRIAAYWRMVPVRKAKLLLSDGRTVDEEEVADALDELEAQGITVVRRRVCDTHKVMMSIVSGAEELEGPFETVFHRIPIVTVYANRHMVDGRWTWCGMVRFSRDPQKLLNYNLTTAQEVLAKQPKAPYIVTPKMLEGNGVKAMWDSANGADVPYLPITPDPQMAGGPIRLPPPQMGAAFVQMGQIATDMLKASDGIFDASVGARSNETSGRAIMARQQEGDTATYDYQDALVMGKQSTGELLNHALPKVYDTQRQIRVIGKDGAEDFVTLYEDVQDRQTGQVVKVNDLSKGKYDITVSVGASYDTQRMEFVDALTQLGQGNPLIAQAVPDLIVGAMDFPKAEEAAERIKLLLPPQIQQSMAQGKQMPPEVMQAMQQAEQQMQEAQGRLQQLHEAYSELQQEKAATDADKAQVQAQKAQIQADIKVAQAQFDAREAKFEAMTAKFEAQVARAQQSFAPSGEQVAAQ